MLSLCCTKVIRDRLRLPPQLPAPVRPSTRLGNGMYTLHGSDISRSCSRPVSVLADRTPPCHPQKLNERPLAPRNTRGVGHREWSEHARPCPRASDVVMLARHDTAFRVEGQVHQDLTPYVGAWYCNALSTVLGSTADAIQSRESANPGTRDG